MVLQIIVENLEVAREQVTDDAQLEEDLGADSLDKVQITMAIEEQLDLTIADEPLFMEIASVQNLTFYTSLMTGARDAILDCRFPSWRSEWLDRASTRL